MEEAGTEELELRLLTEPSFVEEFDTVVDEVTDQYARNELEASERRVFEAKFLATAEGQQKLSFASELLERAIAERDDAVPKPVSESDGKPGFFEWIGTFWQSQSMRLAASGAAVVIIAVGIFLISDSFRSRSKDFAMLDLSISNSTRGGGNAPASVKLESGIGGIQANLAIPEQARGAKDYRVKLIPGDGPERDLTVDHRTDQVVIVKVPASLLRRGQYAIQMFSVHSDGTSPRIPGSYYFDVE